MGILLENPRRGRRRRKSRKGRMPAALRAYWAGRRSNPGNPTRRRRRRRSSSRRRARRSNPGNPRRRTRSRRRSSRRRHSNPFRLPGLGGLSKTIGGAVGMVAAEFAGDFLVSAVGKYANPFLNKVLPGRVGNSGPLRILVGLGGAWAMKRFGGSIGRRYADTFRAVNVFFGVWYIAGSFGLPRGSEVAHRSGLGDYARVGLGGALPDGSAYGMLGDSPQLYDYAVSRDGDYTGLPEYAG